MLTLPGEPSGRVHDTWKLQRTSLFPDCLRSSPSVRYLRSNLTLAKAHAQHPDTAVLSVRMHHRIQMEMGKVPRGN